MFSLNSKSSKHDFIIQLKKNPVLIFRFPVALPNSESIAGTLSIMMMASWACDYDVVIKILEKEAHTVYQVPTFKEWLSQTYKLLFRLLLNGG